MELNLFSQIKFLHVNNKNEKTIRMLLWIGMQVLLENMFQRFEQEYSRHDRSSQINLLDKFTKDKFFDE